MVINGCNHIFWDNRLFLVCNCIACRRNGSVCTDLSFVKTYSAGSQYFQQDCNPKKVRNEQMKVLIIIVIYGLFFLMCYLGTGTLKKNMKSFYSYPDEIQNRVRNNELLANMIPKPKTMMQSFISNLILFSIVFILVGLLFALCILLFWDKGLIYSICL